MTISTTTAEATTAQARRLAAGMLGVGFVGTTVPASLRELIEEGVRCVVLFERNFESRAQIKSLIGEIKACVPVSQVAASPARKIQVCVDHEGGRVQRFRKGFAPIPSMRDVGESSDPIAATREVAIQIADDLADIGVDLDFAPVVDVDTNPQNKVIGDRSFGRDPQLVGRCAAAFIHGLQPRVAACAKHFPGHGDTILDSHVALPRVTHPRERLELTEWPPFRAAIGANVAAIMTAHVVLEAIDPARPATLSPLVVHGLLRREFGFRGQIFSDDLEMKAIADNFGFEDSCIDAVNAGCDVLLLCSDLAKQRRAIETLTKAIVDGRVRLRTAQF